MHERLPGYSFQDGMDGQAPNQEPKALATLRLRFRIYAGVSVIPEEQGVISIEQFGSRITIEGTDRVKVKSTLGNLKKAVKQAGGIYRITQPLTRTEGKHVVRILINHQVQIFGSIDSPPQLR